jgi:hypothetical protein
MKMKFIFVPQDLDARAIVFFSPSLSLPVSDLQPQTNTPSRLSRHLSKQITVPYHRPFSPPTKSPKLDQAILFLLPTKGIHNNLC